MRISQDNERGGVGNSYGWVAHASRGLVSASRRNKLFSSGASVYRMHDHKSFAIALGWLVLTNRIQIWHIIFFAALLGISIAFEMPAISALVPELVRRDEIAAAVAMDRSVFHGSRLIGPSLAGLFVGWWGAASAFFANAFSFLALIVALISLPKRVKGTPEEEEQRRSGIMDGFRYVRSDRIIMSMIMLIACTTIFVFPVISVMLPLYVRNVLQLGPSTMGWLMATSGTGSFLGSLG